MFADNIFVVVHAFVSLTKQTLKSQNFNKKSKQKQN